MMFGFVDPESGLGILISVKMLIMAALGGAGLLFGPLVGAAILVPLEEISNNLLGGKGAGLTYVVYGAIIVRDRTVPAGRHPGADHSPRGEAREGARYSGCNTRCNAGCHGIAACFLKPATVTKAFGSFKAVDAASASRWSRATSSA